MNRSNLSAAQGAEQNNSIVQRPQQNRTPSDVQRTLSPVQSDDSRSGQLDKEGQLDIKGQVDKAVKSSKELQLLRPFMSQKQDQIIQKEAELSVESEQAPEPIQQVSFSQVVESAQANMQNATLEISSESPQQEQVDPLVFDLDGNGFHTTGTADGVQFDLDADGRVDQMSNLTGADAFLALDKNNNGRIDDGSELFGDQNGAQHGFEELAKYDDNRDGVIDQKDAVFDSLQLVRFDGNEQHSTALNQHNIQSISLAYKNGFQQTQAGDLIAQTGLAQSGSGHSVNIADIKLNIIHQ